MSQAEGVIGSSGLRFRTVVFWAVASYALYEVATDVSHGVLEAVDGNDNPETAEWLRRQPLLDALIFGGDPDPDDDDEFRMLLERAVLYGGLSIKILAHAIGVSGTLFTFWHRKNYTTSPPKHRRREIIAALRKAILKE